jgi:hypothetical protein
VQQYRVMVLCNERVGKTYQEGCPLVREELGWVPGVDFEAELMAEWGVVVDWVGGERC